MPHIRQVLNTMKRNMSNLKPEIEDKICKKKLELKIATVSDLQHLTKH